MSRPLHELVEANVRRYASAKSMPLDAVARASGITTERLLAIFSGEYDPDLELVGRIAESLRVRICSPSPTSTDQRPMM